MIKSLRQVKIFTTGSYYFFVVKIINRIKNLRDTKIQIFTKIRNTD